jgi:hypothetical protein
MPQSDILSIEHSRQARNSPLYPWPRQSTESSSLSLLGTAPHPLRDPPPHSHWPLAPRHWIAVHPQTLRPAPTQLLPRLPAARASPHSLYFGGPPGPSPASRHMCQRGEVGSQSSLVKRQQILRTGALAYTFPCLL